MINQRRGPDPPNPSANFTGCRQEGTSMSVISKITTRTLGIIAGLTLVLGIGLPPACRPKRPRPRCGTRLRSARAVATGRSTPATATTVGCSSPPAPGRVSAARPTPAKPTGPRKSEQIAIARRVLAVQGRGAWPTCGRRAGLTKQNGKADRYATPATNPGAVPAHKTIIVKRGDTIRKLAKRHHVEGGWKGLWKLNKKTVKDPNRIEVGQVLKIN